MRNIRLVIEYDGSRYDGWQKQARKGSNTIQDKIENVLEKMEGEKIEVIGAARTEAGVHAYQQVANFKTNSDMKLYEIKHYLNRFLPMDIAVLEVDEVPSVFQRKYNYYSFQKLDSLKMRDAAKYLIGKHDFKAFSDNKRMKKSTVREIYDIDIYMGIEEMSITIHADDFWPHMARIIVGTLIKVGKGEMEPKKMKDVLESLDREQAGETAEAKGLFLQEVCYK